MQFAKDLNSKIDTLGIDFRTSSTSENALKADTILSKDISFRTKEDRNGFTELYRDEETTAAYSLHVKRTHYTAPEDLNARFVPYKWVIRQDYLFGRNAAEGEDNVNVIRSQIL